MSSKYVSHSLVRDFIGCPRRVLLRNLIGVRSTRKLRHLEFGSEIHEALVDVALDRVDDESPYSEGALTIARRGVDCLRRAGLRVIRAEYPIVLPVEGWAGFLAFVDLVCEDEQGRTWIVDTKSVNRVHTGTLRHDPQLMLYRYAAERKHRTRPSKWSTDERAARPLDVFRTAQLQVLRHAGDDACVLTEKGRKPSTSTSGLVCTWERWAASCRALGFDPADYEAKVRPALDSIVWARLVPHEDSGRARNIQWAQTLYVAHQIAANNRSVGRLVNGTPTWQDFLPFYPTLLDTRGPRKNDPGGRCNPETPLAVRCDLAEHCHEVIAGLAEPDQPDGEIYRISRRRRKKTKQS